MYRRNQGKKSYLRSIIWLIHWYGVKGTQNVWNWNANLQTLIYLLSHSFVLSFGPISLPQS